MNKSKEIWITGFALFSLFFGAGNLILPPSLGVKAGFDWWLVTFGFVITAVFIPILAIIAHAKLQGTLFDFGKKVSPIFSTIYCILIYVIAIAIPSPRTASVTHEMAIAPFFDSSALLTSFVYFSLVLIFALNRSKIIHIVGSYLTPIIVFILLLIISVSLFSISQQPLHANLNTPFVSGILEGYQTFDAIGGVVVGGVLIISLNLRGHTSFELKKELVTKAGIIAGLGLFFIYGGLIFSGALQASFFEESATRTEILAGISTQTLGTFGTTFLSVLVALACFTTAVGVVTGTADYFKELFKNSQKAYQITAFISCIIGVIVGSYNVAFIIDVAVPALLFLYPITIVLIFLNVVPTKLATPTVFKWVVLITFVFSIPDFLGYVFPTINLNRVKDAIPFANDNLGWVLPALITFCFLNLKKITKKSVKV